MKTTKLNLVLSLLVGVILLNSCEKDFSEFFNEQFPETDKTSTQVIIDGEIAAPLLNTSLSLETMLPTTDSSLWVEVGNKQLIHLKSYYKDLFVINATSIFPIPASMLKPGIPIPPGNTTLPSKNKEIKLFKKILEGKLFFNDPKFNFYIFNEIPIVTYFKLDTLMLKNEKLETLNFEENVKHHIKRPNTPGQIIKDTISISKTDIPGIEDFFTPIPKYIASVVTIGSDNPQQIPTAYNPHLSGNEKIKVDLELDLPLNIKIKDLVLSDTFPFQSDQFKQYDMIDSVKIKIELNNELPINGTIQVAVVDTNAAGNIQDTLALLLKPNGMTFKAATVSSEGIPMNPKKTSYTTLIPKKDIVNIFKNNGSKIIVGAHFNSYDIANEQKIKIFSFLKLNIKLGIKISYNADTSKL